MFSGFSSTDFDAYASKKWKSNVFNRERLEVKQKLVALGRDLQSRMVAADGSPLAVEASVEHPALWNHKQVDAQHLFFSRNQGARKELDGIIDRQKSLASLIDDPTPLRNHVSVAISLSHDVLELCVKLHPDARVDRQNLERKCEDHFERERFLRLLQELGAPFRAGITPELIPTVEIDDARLRAMVGQLAQSEPALPAPSASTRVFYVGRALPRDEAVGLQAGLLEVARAAAIALLDVYNFIAWSRDNDFVQVREALQKEKQARRQKGLARNDAVRIVRGLFAGKSGVVQEVDAKGGLKVLVGKVAVKVDAEDVLKN